jgi:hypothetical protein
MSDKPTFKPSYKEALKAPVSKGGKGWAHADADSMQAASAQSLGMTHCMNPDAIDDWAKKHEVVLLDHRKEFHDDKDILLAAVLNDWSLAKAKQELAAADKKVGKA